MPAAPQVFRRTPATERAMEYGIADAIGDLAQRVGQELRQMVRINPELRARLMGEVPNEIPEELKQDLIDIVTGAIPAAGATIRAPKHVAKNVRKLMQAELQRRGKPPVEPEERWMADVLRGTWFHGRRTYPKWGETFERARLKEGNLGEPRGLSLTAARSVAESFGRSKAVDKLASLRNKAINKLEEAETRLREYQSEILEALESVGGYKPRADEDLAYDIVSAIMVSGKAGLRDYPTVRYILSKLPAKVVQQLESFGEQIDKHRAFLKRLLPAAERLYAVSQKRGMRVARVMPKFAGLPEKQVLRAWKAPETKADQRILKEAYVEAAKQIFRLSPSKRAEIFKHPNPDEVLMHLENAQSTFNELISDYLQRKGYKALLYSPYRYGEYELRMLDPSDVLMVDMRRVKHPSVERMYGKSKEGVIPSRKKSKLWRWKVATSKGSRLPDEWGASLRDIYKDIDIEKEILEPLMKEFSAAK